jgi:hypothetical protein
MKENMKQKTIKDLMNEIMDRSLFTDSTIIEIDIGCLESILEEWWKKQKGEK